MATAKKTTTKAAPKKPAAKKTVAKRATAEKSFVATKDSADFSTFRVTKQTVYWSILLIIILILGVWVLNLSLEVSSIYDQIETTNADGETIMIHKKN